MNRLAIAESFPAVWIFDLKGSATWPAVCNHGLPCSVAYQSRNRGGSALIFLSLLSPSGSKLGRINSGAACIPGEEDGMTAEMASALIESDFDSFMVKVDKVIGRMSGLTSEDLPDYDYRTAFEDGVGPAQAARCALTEAGFLND